MESALRQDEWRAADALQSAYASNANQNPELAARLLRSLGRLRQPLVEPWGRWLAAGALVHQSVLLRTAGVRALEMWGDDDAVGVLHERSAREPVQWLARYMRQVAQDLSL